MCGYRNKVLDGWLPDMLLVNISLEDLRPRSKRLDAPFFPDKTDTPNHQPALATETLLFRACIRMGA